MSNSFLGFIRQIKGQKCPFFVDVINKTGKKDYLIGYKNNKKAHVVLYCFNLYYQCNILSF